MYTLIELQTTGGATVIVTPRTFEDRLQAESAYHTALAAAAVSSVEIHAVALLDERGNTVKRDYYEHLPPAEPEPEEAEAE